MHYNVVSATLFPPWASRFWTFTVLVLQLPAALLVDHRGAFADEGLSAMEQWAAQREQALMDGLGLVAYVCLRLRFF